MSHVTPATPKGRKARQSAIRRNTEEILPLFGEMERNLCSVLDNATEADIAEGVAWYPAAHAIAADIATGYGLSVAQAAGILAALSPQNGWASNIGMAVDAAAAGTADGIGHYTDATDKVSAILDGADPFDVLGGRKVRSFFSNILRPHRNGPVTVDRHMVDLLVGRRGAVKDRVLERAGVYAQCAAVIRKVARDRGMLAHEVQAVAWVAWRNLHDVAYRFDANF